MANTTTSTLLNYPPIISPVSSQFVVVGQQLVFTNQAYDPDTPLIFSLDWTPDAPAGAVISTNGIFSWSPACAQGSTTNSIKVWVTDSGTPPASNSLTFVVMVSECVQVSIGSTVMQIGTTSSVPVNLLSTVALTNLSFALTYPINRFTNWTLTPSNTAIGSVFAQALDSTDAFFRLATTNGQVLQGPALAGIIGFSAMSNSSAFVPLNIISVQGTKSDGTPVGNTFGVPGRVVVIGPQPLLEAWMATNHRMLTVYGNPGSSYQTLLNTNLLTTNWLAGWRIPQTNLAQVYEATELIAASSVATKYK